MGSGKSTIAKMLSREIYFEHIDTDSIIEKQNCMTVNQIFKKKGVEYFRNEESKLIDKILNKNKIVISTGGGFVCNNDIIKKINKNDISIYLKLTSKKLYERLKFNHKKRPLLLNIKSDKLKKYINDLLSERENYYSKSKIIIDCNKLSKEEILRKINSLI